MRFAPRRARKKDQSEKLIRAALEKAGWLVYDELPCDLLAMKLIHWMHCAVYAGQKCNCDRFSDRQAVGIKDAHPNSLHWQHAQGMLGLGGSIWTQLPDETYRASIEKFFRAFPWEMDALRFQHRYAPDDTSRLWMEWLQVDRREEPTQEARP